MVKDNCNYRVRINPNNLNIFDVNGRIEEIKRLKDWLDELTEWQPDMYELRIHSMGNRIDVWFANEHDAALCALRWP